MDAIDMINKIRELISEGRADEVVQTFTLEQRIYLLNRLVNDIPKKYSDFRFNGNTNDPLLHVIFTDEEISMIFKSTELPFHGQELLLVGVKNDETLLNLLDTLEPTLSKGQITNLIINIKNQETKQRLLEKYIDILGADYVSSIIASFDNDEIKLEYLINVILPMGRLETTSTIVRSFKDDNNKTQFIDDYVNYLDGYTIAGIIYSMKSTELKIQYINRYIDMMDKESIKFIVMSFDKDQDKIDYMEPYLHDITGDDTAAIVESFSSDEEKIKYINAHYEDIYKNDMDALGRIVESFKTDTLLTEYVDKYHFDGTTLGAILFKIEDDDIKIEYMHKYEKDLNMSWIASIIASLRYESNIIKELDNYFDEIDTNDLIAPLNKLNDESIIIKYIEKHIATLADDYYFMSSVVKKLSDQTKVDFINKHLKELSNYVLEGLVVSLKDDKLKIKYLNTNSEELNTDRILESLSSDQEKMNYIKEYGIKSYEIEAVLNSLKTDELKLELYNYAKETYKYDTFGNLIVYFKSDELKLELFLEEYLNRKLYAEEIKDIIYSVSSSNKLLAFIEENEDSFYETSIYAAALFNFKDIRAKMNYLVKWADLIKPENISEIAQRCSNIKLALDYLLEQIDNPNLSAEIVGPFIAHLFTVDEKYSYIAKFSKRFENDLLTLYTISGLTPEIKLLSNQDLQEARTKFDEKYNGVTPSVSDLKSLIGRQAKINVAKEKQANPDKYLPIDLVEQLAKLSEDKSYKEIRLDEQYQSLHKKMDELLKAQYDTRAVANILSQNNNKNIDIKQLLTLMLKQLNIKSQNDGTYDLLSAYIDAINEVCTQNQIDLKYFLSPLTEEELKHKDASFIQRALEFRKIYEQATNIVFEKIFEKENKIEGGLLTQLCTHCLNIEQRINEEKEKTRLEKKIIRSLELTDKGKELIDRKRIENLIKKDQELKTIFEDSSIPFPQKMDAIFGKLYPDYEGRKDLKVLYDLMIKDPRFSKQLSSPYTNGEKTTLPLEAQNFKVDEQLQKEKLFISIINTASVNSEILANKEDIIKRIDIALQNIDTVKEMTNQRMELLQFSHLELTTKDALGALLLYLEPVLKRVPVDKNGKPKSLNIDNLNDYLEKTKKLMFLSSRYHSVLSEVVLDTIESSSVQDYYNHYKNATAKRTYRTIPDVNGTFFSKGKPLRYKTYELDDPEQLIAGARMGPKYCSSCFQLHHAQEATFKYITSSPNGIIVAVENEHGEFLGRVYGYRAGNAVHFTRFYYNEPFDFAAAMKAIAEDIIASSEEIEYVTCIPYTSTNIAYAKKNNVKVGFLQKTQEGTSIMTDHGEERGVSIIASKHPVDDTTPKVFKPGPISEKFYKKRTQTKMVIPSNQENIDDDIANISKIIFTINTENCAYIAGALKKANTILYGKDWVIIEFPGKEPIILQMEYDDQEYMMVQQEEINEALIMLKNRQQDDGQSLS